MKFLKRLLENGCNAVLAKLNFIEQVKKSNTEKVRKQSLALNAAPITCYMIVTVNVRK